MHAPGIAPKARFAEVYVESAAPLQSRSRLCVLAIVSWPLMTDVPSVAIATAGTALAYARFEVVAETVVVLSWPSGAPAGANTCTNSRTLAPGASPPIVVRSAIGASPASNTPELFVSQYTAELQPAWSLAMASDTKLPVPLPSTTLPAFASMCVYTTKPPGATCAELFGTSVRLRTTLTRTWSWMRSNAPETGDMPRKYRSTSAAAAPAGTSTSAYTSIAAPGATTPVLVMTLFAALRNVTDQPAGSVI